MKDELSFDIRAFVDLVILKKWVIAIYTVLFTSIGVIYAVLSKDEFVSEGKILPEIQGKSTGGLGQFAGLASLAGVDLNSISGANVDAVRPDLYPDVVTSTAFFLSLFQAEVLTKDNKKVRFDKYYHNEIEDNKELTEKLLKSYPVKDEGILVLNRLNEIRINDLRKRISASIDRKSGIISISCKMPDPVVAAEVSKFAMNYLMAYVKTYRTEKLKGDVDYLAEQVARSRGKYYSTQEKRAVYSDQFKDMMLQSADVQRERIESEYRLSSTFYNELLKKYEEAKFKLHQETPVFKVLDYPVVPTKKIEPRRSIISILSLLISFFFSILIVILTRGNYKKFLIYS